MKTLSLSQLKHLKPCDNYTKDDYKYSKQLLNGREYLIPSEIRELEISLDDKLWVLLRMLSRAELMRFLYSKIGQHFQTYKDYFPNVSRSIFEAIHDTIYGLDETLDISVIERSVYYLLIARSYRNMIPFNKNAFGYNFLTALRGLRHNSLLYDEATTHFSNIGGEIYTQNDMFNLYERMCKLNHIDEIITILNERE